MCCAKQTNSNPFDSLLRSRLLTDRSIDRSAALCCVALRFAQTFTIYSDWLLLPRSEGPTPVSTEGLPTAHSAHSYSSEQVGSMVVLWYVFNRILCDQMTMMDAYAAVPPRPTPCEYSEHPVRIPESLDRRSHAVRRSPI